MHLRSCHDPDPVKKKPCIHECLHFSSHMQGGVTPQGPPANDYFVMSVLTLFCCFMPLGLVALIKSIEVLSFTIESPPGYEDTTRTP